MNAHLYLIVTVLFATASQLIIKWKMTNYTLDHIESVYEKFSFAFSMLFDPIIIIALVLTLISGLAWMIALTKLEISYAFPFTALAFVLMLFLSALLFQEPITYQKVIGVILITSGIIVGSQSGNV